MLIDKDSCFYSIFIFTPEYFFQEQTGSFFGEKLVKNERQPKLYCCQFFQVEISHHYI